MGTLMAARLQRPKMPAVTLGTQCRLKVPILAMEQQQKLLVTQHMQGIRCQLKTQLQPAVLANLYQLHTQVIKCHQLLRRTRTRVIRWRRCQSLTRTLDTRWTR